MNFFRNSNIFIQENAFENVVWKRAVILSVPQCGLSQDASIWKLCIYCAFVASRTLAALKDITWTTFITVIHKNFIKMIVNDCNESCQSDIFQCSKWRKFHQNNISVSVTTLRKTFVFWLQWLRHCHVVLMRENLHCVISDWRCL